jgi:cytochrome c oxidase cbb3-type subunit 3
MSERRDEDRLLEHEVDGIREYDNPLPRWWVWILWATVAWSVVYLVNVIPGVGSGRGREANYESEMALAREKYGSPDEQAAASAVDDATVLAAAQDPATLAAGRATFTTYCASCHREDGGGLIGPNLTDDYWIHGGAPSRVHGTITNGVLDKGMPAWGQVLQPRQVMAAAAFITTLHDTHPKDPKEPQGAKEERGEDGQ